MTAQGAQANPSSDRNPWLVLFFLSLGFFMILLDTTIVNIAIPAMITDLRASLDSILWVLNAYILVYAVLLITAGRLGDLYGQRNLFVAGLAIFTLASAACGLAQDTNQLIAARIVQGAGGALLTPQTLAIITTIFPPERRGGAFGLWGAVAGVAAIAGPTLGGFLVTYASWRWIFFVNVPIGVFVILAALFYVPDIRPGRRHSLDLSGVLVISAGLFAITFGLIEGQRYDWGTVTGFITIPLILVAGAILVVAFFLLETRSEEPLVPLSLFRNRNFAVMNWVSAAVAFGMMGMFLPIVIYFQSVLGYSAIKSGLTLLPMSLVSMPVAPIAGRLADRIGGKYILMLGLALFAAGFGLIDRVAGPSSDWYAFAIPSIVAGVGLGCTFAPMITVAMRNIEPRMAGAASGVFNTTRQLGGVLGSSIVGAVLQNQLASTLHDEAVRQTASLPIPAAVKQQLVDAFSSAARGGFSVGRGQVGGSFSAPPRVPPQVVQQIQQAVHDIWVNGFISAMHPTLAVSVVVLAVGAASCLLVERRRSSAAPEATEAAAAAAG